TTAQGQGSRSAHSAHSTGRSTYLRHGRHVPPARHLLLGRPAVHAGRQGPGDVLSRGQEGPDPQRGHQRSRRHVQLDRCGHRLQHLQPAHAAVLHLLLDVRLPAHRRSGLGRRRQPRQGLPDRRHRRAHHANGEGLQHEDGHSHILASTIPNCRTYDPTYAYELAVIIREGARRMMEEQENIFYYITVMNEAYAQPAMPEGVEEGIIRGMYLLEE